MRKIFVILVLVSTSLLAFGQAESFTNRARALYILDIAKNVIWSKTSSPFDFRIAVLDKDTALYLKMKQEAKKIKEIHKKPVTIMHYTSIDDIGEVDVIFFERKNRYSVDQVFQKIAGKHVLLITEGYQFHKTMINFIIINGHKRYEVNEAKIKAAGLKVDKKLLVSSVKSEADWSNLYEQSLLDIASYKRSLMQQRELIREYKNKLASAESKLKEKNADIVKLQLQVDSVNAVLTALQKLHEQDMKNLSWAKREKSVLQKMNTVQEEQIKNESHLKDIHTELADQREKRIVELNQALINSEKDKTKQKETYKESYKSLEKKFLNFKALIYSILAGLSIFIAVLLFKRTKAKS